MLILPSGLWTFFYITVQSTPLNQLLLPVLLLFGLTVRAQTQVSLGTDVTILRNFSPAQKFFVFGQTIKGDFHFSKRETLYAALVYYSPGKFHNKFIATAKSPQTTPYLLGYNVRGEWRMREISVGWKHYFKGSFDEEKNWNLYGIAGFGLVFTRSVNTFVIDSSRYFTPGAPVLGKGEFKRLTLDVGLGAEVPLGGNFFAYGEAKTWLRASNYPSPYLQFNKNVPLPAIITTGLRILFGY